jgi:ADP-ribose pyrophosphatase
MDAHLKETQKDSRQVYDGHFLKVQKDTIVLPDGKESTREYIKHPGAVAVLPLFDDGSVLMERQFRYPLTASSSNSRPGRSIRAKIRWIAPSAN